MTTDKWVPAWASGLTDNDLGEYIAPTPATLTTLRDLMDAAETLHPNLPPAVFQDDSYGGCDLSWWIGKRRMILAARENGDTYLISGYHHEGRPMVIRPVTPAAIVNMLTQEEEATP